MNARLCLHSIVHEDVFVGYFHSILKEKCGIGIMSNQFEQSIVGFNSNKH